MGYYKLKRNSMFGINSPRKVVTSPGDGLAKFNQTIHGGADAAAKTTECVKSGTSGLMTADVSNHICGNIPGLKKVTPLTTYISLGCKYFVHLCQTGNITFSCKNPI